MYDDLGFNNKQLNIKKVAFVVVVVLFILIVIIEIITSFFNKHNEKVKEDSNPNSSFTDIENTITLTLSKNYNLSMYTPKQNYLLELRSPSNLNIFVSQKDLIENHTLLDIVSVDQKSYLGEFAQYSNLSDITDFAVKDKTAYTYSFHYLDSNTKTPFYLQVIWLETSNCYYIFDIEFPLDDLNNYTKIINETLDSFSLHE